MARTQEIRSLYDFASRAVREMKRGESIIEIGSWMGKSTITLAVACKIHNKGFVYANRSGKKTSAHAFLHIKDTNKTLKQNIEHFHVQQYVRIASHTSRYEYNKLHGIHTRLVFIDGDMNMNLFYLMSHWEKTLNDGGYLLLHDTINHAGPRKYFFRYYGILVIIISERSRLILFPKDKTYLIEAKGKKNSCISDLSTLVYFLHSAVS